MAEIKEKKVFSTELAYVFALVILTLGVAFVKHADFGLSMVVAPAYLLACGLGHARALDCPRQSIHSPRAAALPLGGSQMFGGLSSQKAEL
ncbi:MAG: hypothetical protein MJ088_05490 [Clostridia bacterium]|nr:hypothetical protein [Clostridia bacterium]